MRKTVNCTQTLINTEDGSIVEEEEIQKTLIYCDFCGNEIKERRLFGSCTCFKCRKDICGECGRIEIDWFGRSDRVTLCRDCSLPFKDKIEGIKERVKKFWENDKAHNEEKHLLMDMSDELIDSLRDEYDPNDPKYIEAEKIFKEYQEKVERGDYKNHSQMIRLYRRLLKKIPEASPLAREIDDEIDGHETDRCRE